MHGAVERWLRHLVRLLSARLLVTRAPEGRWMARKAKHRHARTSPSIGRRQAGGFPSFKAAGHGVDVFVAHLLQALYGERGPAATAAMTNDQCVEIRNFFLDVQLDRATTQMRCIRDMCFVPLIFLPDIDNHRFAALRFHRYICR